ncbi:hypothetical protein WJX81_000439 [Elliptochloris bilobata]|uniref:Serine protease n=1 Tax=Elliptochloris bilobata TaxID=381761 RepID=A0AAW1SK76_9CHLO
MATLSAAALLLLLCLASGAYDSTPGASAVRPAAAPSAAAGSSLKAPAPAHSAQAASAEADADAELDDEGTDADWVVLASAVAPLAPPAPPAGLVAPTGAVESSNNPELEEHTWAAALAAWRVNASASTEGIIGPDNRIRVNDTTKAPWRQLGRLTGLVNATEELICTAAMIAPQYLLTAAHCVYLPVTQFIAPSGTNYAAGQQDAAVTPYGVVTAAQTYVPTGYSTRADKDPTDTNYYARRQYDWAVIKLQSAVGAQTRFFPRFPNYKNATGVNMFNAGYPADKSTNAVQMW